MRASLLGAIVLAGLTLAPPASAQRTVEYRSVGDAAAILYDAPTQRGRKLFIAPRGMPFEVVVSIEGWYKIRDRAGEMAWIERRSASERRTVVSTAAAQLRERPEESAPVVLEVAADVVLDVVEPAATGSGGWLRVRHRDGAGGFVRITQVWGH
jgi:SH3-like domain-containing protein